MDTGIDSSVTHRALLPKASTRTSQLSPAAAPAVDAPRLSSLWPSLPPRPFTLPKDNSWGPTKPKHTAKLQSNSWMLRLLSAMHTCMQLMHSSANIHSSRIITRAQLHQDLPAPTFDSLKLAHVYADAGPDVHHTSINPSTALGSTSVCLLGLFLALPILASSLLGPMPAEQV